MNNTTETSAITLENGDYSATFLSVGAAIAALQSHGRDLVYPHTLGEVPVGFLGQALAPWPNRIKDGVYEYDGVRYEAAINDQENHAALHGLVYNQNWQVDDATGTSVTFSTLIPAQPSYPFTLTIRVVYELDAETGLHASITARNIGDTVAPYGVSSHPYLTCDKSPVDECLLTIPAEQVMKADENLAPLGLVPVDAAGVDFRTPAVIGDRQIDNAFAGLPVEPWYVDLTDADAGLTVRMTATEPWLQIFTGDNVGRLGVAVEPMTCPPDVFNSHDSLIELAPGEEYTFSFEIRAVEF